MTSSLLPRPVTRPRSRSRLLGALAAAAVVAVPIAGCGDSSGSGGGGNAGADPAAFLPATAPVYVEAQVRPSGDLATNLDAVAGKILRTGDPAGKVVGWIDAALKDDGASYAKDIAPWLGQRAGLAVTAVGAGGGDADVVAAIATRDDDAAQKFVDARKGTADREYRGVKYKYKADGDTAAAVIDHAVVIGTEKGFKSAVDAKSGAKLADAAQFKKAREVVGTDGAGFAYADPGRFFDLAAGAASGKLSQDDAAPLQMVKGLLTGSGLQSVAASLNVAKDALQVDAAAIGLKARATGKGDGPGAAAAVPAGSWLSVGIGDVGGTFDNALKGLGASGATGGVDPATLLQGLKSQLGFDVQKDLLSWMGDAALFVRGTTMSDLSGALVVKSKDPAASKAAIPKLRKVLKGLNVDVAGLSAAPAGASGFSVDLGSSVPASIDVAAKDDTFVIALGKDALRDALSPSATLGDSAPFKTAAGLLDGAKPSLFLDTPQVVKLIAAVAGSDEDFQKAKPTLDAFGPAAAGVSSDGDVTRLKAAVAIP
ncbi:hypothetical protein DSM104299_02354 [Baekduia alba]|uniref:DUF3352 domain-containing protein n=1 Tax=Baekduia alba TaxID=2997333 RepID=UPI0023414684|nr:DUF3352 domain-containing protein [Baekduia alba]WCB93638.1 hypothetical protein DSM104299_02354 [Baekduia alba]